MYERFTDRARKTMQLADQEAQRLRHDYIGTEHILLGLVKEGEGVAANVLRNLVLDLGKIRLEVEKIALPGPDRATTVKLPQTPKAKKAIEYATEESHELGHNYVGTEHLLLGLLREQEGVAMQVLTGFGLSVESVRQEVLHLLGVNVTSAEREKTSSESTAGRQRAQTPTLDRFGYDLVEWARQGILDPVIGRTAELNRVMCTLCRRSRNSPILIGEVGIGKTALVEGLAQLIAEEGVPASLSGWRIFQLDLVQVLAGTRYRGHLEERLEAVRTEVHRAGKVILFLDNLHLWAWKTSLLSELALRRDPEHPWIATATPRGYEQLLDRAESLARFFQPLLMSPLSREDASDALQELRGRYETHHRLTILDDALQAALDLTTGLAGEVRLDLALTLLDESAANVRLRSFMPPQILRDLAAQIQRLNQQTEAAVAEQDLDLAMRLRDQVRGLEGEQVKLTREWHEKSASIPSALDREMVTQVFRESVPSLEMLVVGKKRSGGTGEDAVQPR